MSGTQTQTSQCPADAARAAREFAHRLLCERPTAIPSLSALLAELATAFAAPAAGLVSWPDAALCVRHPPRPRQPNQPQSVDFPFALAEPGLLGRLYLSPTALVLPRPQGGAALLALARLSAPGPHSNLDMCSAQWLVWVEDGLRASWTLPEAAALTLAGHAMGRVAAACGGAAVAHWAGQLARAARQQRLEDAADLVQRLAHDLGNVLTGVLGFSELALSQPLSAHSLLRNYLDEIHRGAEAAARFTNQLRSFSRRQARMDGASSFAEVLAGEEARMKEAGDQSSPLEVQVEVPANLPPVVLDAQQLRAVLAALLDNAREAAAGQGRATETTPCVRISAQTVELNEAICRDYYGFAQPGLHVEVVISDNGAGLSVEAEHRLFTQPFFSTRSRRRGFGLATAYGILSAHHGGIDLRRGPCGGVDAHVVMPVVPGASSSRDDPVVTASDVPQRPVAAPQEAPSGDRATGERVLVVDDDPMILQFVGRALERAGYRVEAVASGEAALDAYQKGRNDPFRVVVTDVLMPGLDGLDLAQRLLNRDPSVRVVLMSGQTSADSVCGRLSGATFDLLRKPFRPAGLLRAVRAALDSTAAHRDCPAGPAQGKTVAAAARSPSGMLQPSRPEPASHLDPLPPCPPGPGGCEP
jgi:signal transduction histidine kinase/FixJ family two-component response regulator